MCCKGVNLTITKVEENVAIEILYTVNWFKIYAFLSYRNLLVLQDDQKNIICSPDHNCFVASIF